ncbi:ATPase family associated with various cellular activities (AAA) [Gimesia aquarii]|uniref:ATPase family associated with various cellular activities (AAA) n=2 Tax=Gimesia aquarii TaxID=2527964 RepID=A0A517X139_9PLAN|nr:MoxR family ATPase [Gimesia aquarii]QDT97590.1 ATPase family associated with various cellular activities (AAA) [Gimesia aquarii]QDU11226.1 ATPase family associated with various cellular activities (AAA) [Gimesia aquarii]
MSEIKTAPDMVALEKLKVAQERIREQIRTVVIGQDDVVEQLLVSILAGGHCILEGVPGLAKTLLVSTLAKSLSLEFGRIQFTPDLMPADITGTDVIYEDRETGSREFKFIEGPIFTNLLLADEINRTPPKTQAALLQGMQEKNISAGTKHYQLPRPFFVLATQNPIEQEGTYPLPEAQLDRFLMKIIVEYPTRDEERLIYKTVTGDDLVEPEATLTGEEVLELQHLIRRVPISDFLVDYTMDLIRATRCDSEDAPEFINRWVLWGAGPRGGQSLILAAKARAALYGRPEVSVEDLQAVSKSVLRHRIVLSYNAESEGQTADTVIEKLIEETPLHHSEAGKDGQFERILKS